jgi:hypothetical protein
VAHGQGQVTADYFECGRCGSREDVRYRSPEQIANIYGRYALPRKRVSVPKTLLFIAAVVSIVLCVFASMQCGAQDSRPAKVIPAGPSLVDDLRVGDMTTFTPTRPPPTVGQLFKLWAYDSMRVLCERFEVPTPTLVIEPGAAPSLDCTQAKIYEPAKSLMRVYLNDPAGKPFTLDQLRYVFLHSFLHHLHNARGIPHEPGHDKEFDRWLRVLGLWR